MGRSARRPDDRSWVRSSRATRRWFDACQAGTFEPSWPCRSGGRREDSFMEPVCDTALEQQLQCVEGYMRGCALLTYPRTSSPLRRELVGILRDRLPAALEKWVEL